MATFELLSDFQGDGGYLEFVCAECGTEAQVPTNGYCRIEAVIGMGYVHDPQTPPPPGFLPSRIKCRRCHYVYEMDGGEVADVR